MTDPARITAIREQLTALAAELESLAEPAPAPAATTGGVEITNQTFEERGLTGQTRRETVEDARAEARRRGGRTRTEQLAEQAAGTSADGPASSTDGGGSTAEDGRAEAQRRAARR